MPSRITERHVKRFNEAIPDELKVLGYSDGPVAPRATNDLEAGTTHLPPSWAFKRIFIEMSAENCFNGIYQDIDEADAEMIIDEAIEERLVVPPSYVTINDATGHAQVGWFLKTPVHNNPGQSSFKALNFFHAIDAYYSQVLRADSAFSGRIMRNPVHPLAKTEFGSKADGFTLSELASVMPPYTNQLRLIRQRGKSTYGKRYNSNRLRIEAQSVSFGMRNEWIANGAGRGWRKYTNHGGIMYVCDEIESEIVDLNQCLPSPMKDTEVACIIRSLEKQRMTSGFAVQERRRRAADSGRKSGMVRRERTKERDQAIVRDFGTTEREQSALGRKYGLSRKAIHHILRRDGALLSPKERDAQIVDLFLNNKNITDIATRLRTSRPTVYRCLQRNGLHGV